MEVYLSSKKVIEGENKELGNEKNRLKDNIDDLNHLVSELRTELRGYDSRIQSSMAREREAITNHERIQEDIKLSNQKYSHLEQAYNSLLEGSRKDLKEKQAKYEGLMETLRDKSQKDINAKEVEISHYNTEVSNLRVHMEKKIDEITTLTEANNKMRIELASKEDYATMKKELEKLNIELLETEIKKKEESQKVIGKSQEVENLKEGVNKKQEEINHLVKENESLKLMLNSPESNAKLERYERERELLQQKVEALEYELERRSSPQQGSLLSPVEKRKYVERIDNMEEVIMKLEGQVRDLEESNDFLRSKVHVAHSKMSANNPQYESPQSDEKFQEQDYSLQYSPEKETIQKTSEFKSNRRRNQFNHGLSYHAYLD